MFLISCFFGKKIIKFVDMNILLHEMPKLRDELINVTDIKNAFVSISR